MDNLDKYSGSPSNSSFNFVEMTSLISNFGMCSGRHLWGDIFTYLFSNIRRVGPGQPNLEFAYAKPHFIMVSRA